MKDALLLICLFTAGVGVCTASEPNAIRDNVAQNTTIQGYPCGRGETWFYPDGTLDQCTLSRPVTIGDLRVPRGSVIELWPDGGARYLMLQHSAILAGYRMRSSTRYALSRGAATAFYRTGELHSFHLVADQSVQGVPCRGGAWNTFTDPTGAENAVELYQDGKLASCKLSRDFSGYRSGQRIQLPHLSVAAADLDTGKGRPAQ